MSGLMNGGEKQGGFGEYLRSSSTLVGCGLLHLKTKFQFRR